MTVGWLAGIPPHWQALPLRCIAAPLGGLTFGPEDISDAENGTLVLRSSNIQKGTIDLSDALYVNVHVPSRMRLQPGDILVCSRNGSRALIGKNAAIPPELEGQTFGAFMTVLRSSANEFLYWVLNSPLFEQQSATFLTSTINQLTLGNFKSFTVPYPPEDERTRISTFLASETAQIDALIGKQARLIELLGEKRQAVITHAVTKGLDSTAPTKPSGVPWLGHIPETWRTTELKRALTFITSGSRGWAEFYADHGTPFVRIGNLTRGHLHLDMSETQHVDIPRGSEGTRAVVEAGDVLFSITAYLGSVGVASEKEAGSYVSQHVALTRLDQNQLQSRFLAYFVLSEFGQRQLNQGAYGGTKLQLSLEDIKRLWIPVPETSEQIEITRYLDESTTRIDDLLELARRSISLLRERRSALISAAVTGVIDVQTKGTK